MRKIWTGTLGFGLVAIPVGIVTAIRSDRPHFRMLHKDDGSPLARRMFCPVEEVFVEDDEIVRGYEVAQDRYVTVEDDEIRSLRPEESSRLEIDRFVEKNSLREVFLDKPYYLIPTDTTKPYNLLAKTMEDADKVGITKFVMRDKEHLAALFSIDGVLFLNILHFLEDIVDPGDLRMEKPPEPDKYLVREIERNTAEFDPDRYADPDLERLSEMLAAKKDRIIEATGGAGEKREPIDIMEAIERSIREKEKRKTDRTEEGDGE